MRRNERGFLQFLLANPALLGLAALGIALVVTGLAAKVYKAQRDRARAEVVTVKAEYAGFVEATKRKGEEQERATAQTVKGYEEALREAKKRHARDLGARDRELARLRSRPATDPGGRDLPTFTCNPGRADDAAAQCVSVGDYRALEERAYDDARTLMALQEHLRALGMPVR